MNKSMRGQSTLARQVHGILLLDKPPGITSNQALQQAKRLFHARKAGHTGSLDPIASGLLPICMGETTKLSPFLLNRDKRYRVKARLGVSTTTGDTEGEILQQKPVPSLTEQRVEQALARFRGEIDQVPPMYSALKQNGRRLYELARRGIEVERQPRRVTIYELNALAFKEGLLEIEVHCSKGTYIRTLVEDIGNALGTCGHVENLRRTQVGDFTLEKAWTIDQLKQMADEERRLKCLLPVDSAVMSWPPVALSDELAFYVQKGQAVLSPKAPTRGYVRLYTSQGSFMGVGEILENGKVAPRRLFKSTLST